MKNKNLVVGLAVVVLVIIGIIFVQRPMLSRKAAGKTSVAKSAEKGKPQVPAKKTFSKDMGGLTLRVLDSKNKEMSLKVRAFKSVDSKSSVYAASLASGRMQELAPGDYDIVIDSIPQMIYKNIGVSKGKETVEDLGHLTGSINIKALNAKKKDALFPVRILHAKSNIAVTSTNTNRPIEIYSGIYDIEIGTTPIQFKKDVKIEAGKEMVLDFGCTTGILSIRAIDENGKEARYGTRIRRADNNDIVASGMTNRAIEIQQGTYNIEVSSNPVQIKKDVKVNAGEEVSLEFTVQAPPVPPKAATPSRTKK